jgi:DNA-binding NarL/FixJ family response regulator
MPIRTTLADDHPVVLEGLSAILSRSGDVEIVATDRDGDAALRTIVDTGPDVAVLDAVMPGMTGIEILAKVRSQGLSTRIVLLAGELGSDDLTEAIRLGVDGILLKDEAASVLQECVRSTAGGGRWVSIQLLERALNLAADARATESALTARESEIAESVAAGFQNKEIAQQLGIADGTVRIHVHNIFKKFGIQNRVELTNRLRKDKLNPST